MVWEKGSPLLVTIMSQLAIAVLAENATENDHEICLHIFESKKNNKLHMMKKIYGKKT